MSNQKIRVMVNGYGVSYIAVNPASDELVVATFNKDIYLSQNKRQTWQQIAKQGIG